MHTQYYYPILAFAHSINLITNMSAPVFSLLKTPTKTKSENHIYSHQWEDEYGEKICQKCGCTTSEALERGWSQILCNVGEKDTRKYPVTPRYSASRSRTHQWVNGTCIGCKHTTDEILLRPLYDVMCESSRADPITPLPSVSMQRKLETHSLLTAHVKNDVVGKMKGLAI